MHKLFLLISLVFIGVSLVFIGVVLFFVYSVWDTVTGNPNIEYGHILLKDRTGKIITDKGKSGGYGLPYSGSLDTELIRDILQIEDARFYEHSGVNIRAKAASIYQNLRAGEVVRGGSTITEQYVKNAYYSGNPRTILQKIREAIGASIIEMLYTKDTILEGYLSTVYMGQGLYGIETMMSGKNENDMILDIITRLKFPNINGSNRENVLAYRARISERLSKTSEANTLENTIEKQSINEFPIVTRRVIQEVSLYCRGEANILKKWTQEIPSKLCESTEINLTLTIDADLMSQSLRTARGILDSLENKNVTNASIYIIDPRSDTILAYIGNTLEKEEIDMITRRRSVGSLLKPFVYLLALEMGADSEDYIIDDKTSYETDIDGKYYVPENYAPKSYGPIRLREALGNSLNAATVRLTDTLGIPQVYTRLKGAGLSMDQDDSYYGYGISLGTVEATMENIVDTYRSLINPSDVNKWQIAQILSDPRNRAKTFGISSVLNTSMPMSVKTGTSTDFRDNWAVGYSDDIIIGVWVGNTDGSPMGDVSGVSGAGPIWKSITEYMIDRGMIKNKKTPPPKGLNQVGICLDSNCLRKELLYTKKSESPKSRPSEGLYYRGDFFGNITSEEKEKWEIRE